MNRKLIIIACSIFRKELEFLQSRRNMDVPIVYLDSMLHMQPVLLRKKLDETLQAYRDFKIILLYGDCHARMLDYEKNPNILRSPGINCCEILLGSEKYRSLRKEGAFILLPEWINRWKEVFVDYMGFKNAQTAKSFMGEMHHKLVFVDTGLHDRESLPFDEISEFLGLPMEYCLKNTDELEKILDNMMKESNTSTHG
ncbi:MAG TPA: DUF1638 domain-containing protein [Bacteroidales bacterium]|nr:DUF1638 domain-containing protein [Bacteroidales bacterium]